MSTQLKEKTTKTNKTPDANGKIPQVSTYRGEDGFLWSDEREPHFQRRQEILAKYPQVKELFGINPNLKYVTVAIVIIQLVTAVFIHQAIALGGWGWAIFFGATYFVGATIAQALFLAVHEITHNLAFRKPSANNWLAFIANLPLIAPYAMSFKTYHNMHHRDQGKDGVDADIPIATEAKMFRGFIGKLIWFIHQILFYAFRPMIVKRLSVDKWQVYNWVFQITGMVLFFGGIYLAFGSGAAGYAALYLFLSMFLAGSLHPTSGHFISEHYVFEEGQETYSYYGPLNNVTFNVGYHNEHHDFPRIPGSRLPELRKMAPEFYDTLHSYDSWTKVIIKFLFRGDINLYSRTKRK